MYVCMTCTLWAADNAGGAVEEPGRAAARVALVAQGGRAEAHQLALRAAPQREPRALLAARDAPQLPRAGRLRWTPGTPHSLPFYLCLSALEPTTAGVGSGVETASR
jgi:hypothetical protein